MILFDHLKLIRGDLTELARFRGWLLGGSVGEVRPGGIMHEHDNSCCRREAWNDTMTRLVAAIKPPTGQVAINLNPPGAS